MKKFLILLLFIPFFTSCNDKPIMYSSNYQVIDTIGYNKSATGGIHSYDVIIKIDTSFFYGKILWRFNYPVLVEMEGKINLERLK